jgi:hypothetical protein
MLLATSDMVELLAWAAASAVVAVFARENPRPATAPSAMVDALSMPMIINRNVVIPSPHTVRF